MAGARTLTIGDCPYRAALRAVFLGLRQQIKAADSELEGVIVDPTGQPASDDAARHLADVESTIGALRALGWPLADPERTS